MKKMYIVIAIITLLVLAGLYLAFDYWKVIGTQGPNTKINAKPQAVALKAYSLSYATLNPQADHPDFKSSPDVQGVYWTTLIVPLPNNEFLVTKFSHPVLEGKQFTQGNTYIYTNNKFSLAKINLNYKDGALDGRIMGWGSGREGSKIIERALIIHYAPAEIINIDNAADFKAIQQLPGFEKATYREVKNLQDK